MATARSSDLPVRPSSSVSRVSARTTDTMYMEAATPSRPPSTFAGRNTSLVLRTGFALPTTPILPGQPSLPSMTQPGVTPPSLSALLTLTTGAAVLLSLTLLSGSGHQSKLLLTHRPHLTSTLTHTAVSLYPTLASSAPAAPLPRPSRLSLLVQPLLLPLLPLAPLLLPLASRTTTSTLRPLRLATTLSTSMTRSSPLPPLTRSAAMCMESLLMLTSLS